MRFFWVPLSLLLFTVACETTRPGTLDAGVDGGPAGPTCPTSFLVRPSFTASTVTVLGEWHGFERTSAAPLVHDGHGAWTVTLNLPPGTYGYLFLVNGAETLDPSNGAVRLVDGKSYSKRVVADCYLPSLEVVPGSVEATRPAPGQGSFAATLRVVTSGPHQGLRVEGTVRLPDDHVQPGYKPRLLTTLELSLSAAQTQATMRLQGLKDGKYVVAVRAFRGDAAGPTLLLPFWVEASAFSYRDGAMYMLVTDRFRNGDPSNDPTPQAGVPTSASFQGGDLLGVEQTLKDGYFDRLGVRSLWLTPWQTQPSGPYPSASGTVSILGYHGYWPVKAREVDPRLGDADALHRVVEEAHRRGIRVVMDAVLNHVHKEHEYYVDPARKGWFRTGCVCGSAGCGWDDKRLECLFTDYMPDVNWTVRDAQEQLLADVAWWVEEFDLDGLRLDAVKHVEDSAIASLTAHMRERFEQAGTDFFMFGETFTDSYDLINHYIGPTALDAQLDFPLFMKVPETVFGRDDQGFQHAKSWLEQSQAKFGEAPMVTFVGNHDVPRFITAADPVNRDRRFNQWSNLPGAPSGQEPYDRLWLSMLHLFTSPGVPLVYYGDEYGEFGGADPDNRHMKNRETTLWPEQRAQLDRMSKLILARSRLRGLARGPLTTLWCNSEDNGKGNLWAYTRTDPDPRHSAVVVLNRTASTWTGVVVRFPPSLGFTSGKVYDLLSGREWTITNQEVTVDVPGRGGLILGLR